MESKKINQLATELAPELSDLTIIGDPTTGISKKITLSQMASLFTGTVEEYANLASFPLVGTADTIYIALDTNIIYRWNTGTSAYVELSPNIVTSLVFSDANGFDGTISLVGSTATLTITTALTQGSVPFIGTSGALSQDNANLFFDDTNNRLGINTNVPTTALDIFGSGIIGRLNGTSTNNAFLGFASAGSNKWSIGNVQSDHRFRIYNEATTSELVSVLQTGEFGIGIANPLTKLHIFGGASALIANLDANTSVAKSISFRSGNSSRINLEVSGTESGSNAGADLFIRRYSDAGALIDTPFYIQRSTGYIGIATTTPNSTFSVNGDIYASNKIYAANGTAANPSFRFFAGASGLYSTTGDDLGISTNGANRLYISSTGLIGIGTNTPNVLLEVKGGSAMTTLANSYTNAGFIHQYNSTNILAIGSNGSSMIIQGVNAGTNGAVPLLLQPFGGSLGIGTTNPTAWNGNQGLLVSQTGTGNTNTIYSLQSAATSVDTGGILEAFSTNTTSGSKALGSIVFLRENTSTTALSSYTGFYTNNAGTVAERMRITSSGNLGIGTSSPLQTNTNRTVTTINGTNDAILNLATGGTLRGYIYVDSSSYTELYSVGQLALLSNASQPMTFATNGSERMRITSGGYVKASNNGTYYSSGGSYHEFLQSASSNSCLRVFATSTSYDDAVQQINCYRTNNSAYSMAAFYSNNFSDLEFNFRGDGQAYADGSWNGGGADYAEYFEWFDGNPSNEDRRGYSVSLVGNKIKIAEKGETIIGVISGNPSVVGDSAWNIWTEKYLRDDFGTYVRDENGDRILNPNYNPDIEYIPREQRPEWGIVGLMGKLCIRKGQEVMPTWVKMKDVSDSVEQWLIK